ncbi:Mov34/MPN/PAD-1 family protein [Falsiroseomonas sp. E2-1-a20]|uniref:Mov34/MPN/PAD-1 family protein n=1 Tax=Falsiroseomonas sp. E2-1-a20 TaxID=3239300 RepID=UPI003F2F5867
MALHPVLDELGTVIGTDGLQLPRARALAIYLASDDHAEANFLECRRREADGQETVVFEIGAERPQDLAADIRRLEPIAAVFTPADDRTPVALAARPDFPETPHQNAVPTGFMRYPCVDDRPWAEARATWTPLSFVERVRWWLGAAASGALSDEVQALDPLFVATGPDVAVPRAFLQPDASASYMKLFGGAGGKQARLYHFVEDIQPGGQGTKELQIVPVRLPPQAMRAIRSAPGTLAELIGALNECGFDLLSALRDAACKVMEPPHSDTMAVAVLVITPISRNDSKPVSAEDAKAFFIPLGLGDLGERLGVLFRYPRDAPEARRATPFGRNLRIGLPERLDEIKIDSLPVHAEFDRALASECAGLGDPDVRRVALIGAGAIGSHLAMALAREGRFSWTILDTDHLLPHNLARHTLGRRWLGAHKAEALANEVRMLLGEQDAARAVDCNALAPAGSGPDLEARIANEEVIIDASASVAVARRLADGQGRARRVSVFLNPTGTAAVMLSEDAARTVRLDALEAQYYRVLLRDGALRSHLVPPPGGLRYTGACRHVSARIPETNVMALSALTARGLATTLDNDGARITVWTMDADGGVSVVKHAPRTPHQVAFGEWKVSYDDGILERMKDLRKAALPSETGGALVGIVDTERQSIIVVDALDPPSDSVGTPGMFERGISGLLDRLREIQAITRDQVRYIGEWHSHPIGHGASPSSVDTVQLRHLCGELGREGIPPVMMIVGDGQESVVSTIRISRDVFSGSDRRS